MTGARPVMLQALEAFDRRQWELAFRLAHEVARASPRDADSRLIGGISALQAGNMLAALQMLEEGVALAPERLDLAAQHARALAMTGRYAEAARAGLAALRFVDDVGADAVSCDTLGIVLDQTGLHAEALRATRRAVALEPSHAGFRFNLATLLMFGGDFSEAASECEACLARDPRHWRAWIMLAQLRRHPAAEDLPQRLQSALAQVPYDPDAQLHLNVALANTYEESRRYEEAFACYARAKAVHRRRIRYDHARDALGFDAIRRAFERTRDGPGFETSEPIFITGMPRSGTTLIDRIISAHSQVHAAGELSAFETSLRHAAGGNSGALLQLGQALPTAMDWTRLGRDYLAATRPATGHTARFTDKMPHNFLFVGFMARALPRCRIVLVLRNPLDTCMGNFRQLFAPGVPRFDYSYDLLDIGRYYVQFDRLVRWWHEALPGRIIEVHYEKLVADQTAQTRQLLSACALGWEEDVMHPECSGARVASASAIQVRNPINTDSLFRWRRFEKELHELRMLLSESGIDVD